ncbi:hypothetical protein PINS_up017304 [Pythium insidiosum]|nr:hypothetical protein PINS_up017304 [Pythium insidiosum]
MRRALQRAKAGRILDRKRTHNEMVANVDRHMKVLTRYKIRRVTIEEDGTSKLSGLGFLMVNPHTARPNGSSSGNLNILGLLKALRIPRLLRLVRLLRVVKILKIRPEFRRWLQYSRHANLLRLVRLVLVFLIINHYVACIWYGASQVMRPG